MIRRWSAAFLGAVAALVAASAMHASPAQAQGATAEVQIDQLQPPSPNSPFTRAEGPADRFDTGIGYGFRFTTDYGLAPLRSSVGDDVREPVAHALLGHLGAGITPLQWLTVEVGWSFAAFETGEAEDRLNSFIAAGEAGVGGLRLGTHLRPYIDQDLSFSLGARVWAPLGMPETYLTSNERFFRVEVVPAIAGDIDLLRYGCTLGLAPLFFAGRDGDRLALSCATQFKLAPVVAMGLEPHAAIFSFSGVDLDARSEHTPGLGDADVAVAFEPLATISFKFGGFLLTAAGGPGLGNAPGTPKARALLSFGWNARGERVELDERPSDRDVDGIPDGYDACPDEAGSKKRRGCPDPRDTDGDGIVDGDACPDEPGANYEDPDANGCPDRDNDHVADPVDACPTEPGSGDGCPEMARLADGDFVIEPPIAFRYGQARLSQENVDALVEVIRTLRANPKIEQINVKLGTRRGGRALTDRRADALLQLFNEQNLDSARYQLELDDDLQAGSVEIHVAK